MRYITVISKHMKQETKLDTKFIGYTTVAALMGMGFATAMGVSAQGYGVYVKRDAINEDRRVAVETALEEGDYESFVAIIEEVRPQAQVAEDQFEEMQVQYMQRKEYHAQLEAILRSGDYDAWVTFMEQHPRITEVITEEIFDRYVVMHEALGDGGVETWIEVRDEFGLPMGHQWHKAP